MEVGGCASVKELVQNPKVSLRIYTLVPPIDPTDGKKASQTGY